MKTPLTNASKKIILQIKGLDYPITQNINHIQENIIDVFTNYITIQENNAQKLTSFHCISRKMSACVSEILAH